MKKKYLLYSLVSLLLLSGCYDREEKIAAPIVGELSDLQYKVDDDTLRVSWNLPSHNDDLQVRVSGTDGTFVVTGNPTSYKYGVIKVGKDYRLTFKVIDSKGNYSTGQTISFTREGGASVQDVIAQQVDGTNNIQIKWVLPNEKLSKVEVRYDNKKIELKGDAVNYTIENAANKLSDFGDGIGAHGGVWECPDLIQMDYNGQKKWVLLVSINPGGPNGGSATQYFVGDFDGVTFTADNLPYPLWIDYGKDNYAGVTWNNVPDGRHLFIAWMSNWQYAGVVPSMTWRGCMTLPRELALQKDADGRPIITSRIVKEVDAIAREWKTISASDNTYAIDNNEDAYELQINMDIADNENLTLTLSNEKGDKYPISLNRADKSFIIDRTQSGEVSFSSEFGKVLYSPLNLSSNAVSLTLFVDKSSVEALINDGMVQQTNLVYPSGIYNSLSVESGKGQIIKSVKVRTLSSVW